MYNFSIPTPKYKIGDIVIVSIDTVADCLEEYKPYGLLECTDQNWSKIQTIAIQVKIKKAECCDFTISSELFKTIKSDEYESTDAQWMYGFEYDGSGNLEMVGEDRIIEKI